MSGRLARSLLGLVLGLVWASGCRHAPLARSPPDDPVGAAIAAARLDWAAEVAEIVARHRDSDAGESPGPAYDPTARHARHFERIASAADAGDMRALGWCLEECRFVSSPSVLAAEQASKPRAWWRAYIAGEPDDESIRRVVSALATSMLVLGDVAPDLEVLVARAESAEIQAEVLEREAQLFASVGDEASRARVRERLAATYPETRAGARAAAGARRGRVLRIGEPFPGYADRRFIDLERALAGGWRAPSGPSGPSGGPPEFRLADFRGQVLALVFWDYACGFCLAEVPFERDLLARLGPSGFEILGVYTDSDLDEFERGARRRPVPWRNAWDAPGGMRAGPLCRELGVTGVPFTVVLDQNGIVRAVDVRKERLAAAVEETLGLGRTAPR